jgi:2-dehydro-3-deoxyphosphogluconate aldolase/(4S)-4-hydroxy-2-oxoglutarate aldolase
MTMHIEELPASGPVIAVIQVERLEHAVPLAEALVAGGLRVLEVTLRTPMAMPAMRAMARAVPQAIVGAGTLRDPIDAARVRDFGAQFAASPGYSAALGEACRRVGLPLLPGVASPGEVMRAQGDGFGFQKLFPAAVVGGLAMLRALAGPFPEVSFCPTGGVTLANAAEYLALPNVRCVGGSWVVPAQALAAQDWDQITALAAQAVALRA